MKARFVIPWYGENIPGGAESECRRTAENLQQNGVDIEVLTTCAKDAYHWDNHYKQKTYEINNVTVKRFKLDRSNHKRFNEVNSKLMAGATISDAEENVFIKEMINSQKLYDYIANHQDGLYFFIPYMFGTTYFGSKIHPHLSYLIPCLHDESYAYLNIFQQMFKNAKGIIFQTNAEKKLAERIYDFSDSTNHRVIGTGVDSNFEATGAIFRKKYNIPSDFILYAGRKDVGKNILLLIDYFTRFKKTDKSDLKLVIIGSGDIDIPIDSQEHIIDLGFVSLEDKYNAYGAALAHCQPSTNESFSLTIMESWLSNTPVIVHEKCAVTKEHCLSSNGGLFFGDVFSFSECLNYLTTNSNFRKTLGANGREYVLKNYSWDIITKKYLELLDNHEN